MQWGSAGPRFDNAIFLFFQTEEWQTEYDVARAAVGVPATQAVHILTNTFKAEDLLGNWGEPRRAYLLVITCAPALGDLQ